MAALPRPPRRLIDPTLITIVGGFFIGLVSGLWRSFMLGWLLGLLVGIVYALMQTAATPVHMRRLRFTQFTGSRKYGSGFSQDSRLLEIFWLGVAGLVSELLGLGLFKLLARFA